MSELSDRLRARAEEGERLLSPTPNSNAVLFRAAASELDARSKHLAETVEVLRPFAIAASGQDSASDKAGVPRFHDIYEPKRSGVNLGELRAASALLIKLTGASK